MNIEVNVRVIAATNQDIVEAMHSDVLGVETDHAEPRKKSAEGAPAFLFDLDGTLVDSIYQHVLAWREALEEAGTELVVWRIHRRIGMSGGLFVNALLRETDQRLSADEVARLQRLHEKLISVCQRKFVRCPARANSCLTSLVLKCPGP